jgi:hypothetical protein
VRTVRRQGRARGLMAPVGVAATGPAEEQPVAHDRQTSGHHEGGDLFEALDHRGGASSSKSERLRGGAHLVRISAVGLVTTARHHGSSPRCDSTARHRARHRGAPIGSRHWPWAGRGRCQPKPGPLAAPSSSSRCPLQLVQAGATPPNAPRGPAAMARGEVPWGVPWPLPSVGQCLVWGAALGRALVGVGR